jgi:hypothetical protein
LKKKSVISRYTLNNQVSHRKTEHEDFRGTELKKNCIWRKVGLNTAALEHQAFGLDIASKVCLDHQVAK